MPACVPAAAGDAPPETPSDSTGTHGLISAKTVAGGKNRRAKAPPSPSSVTARSLEAELTPARLTWNELQRRTGGKGFSKEQMSLMWSAYKAGPLTYNQFRSHCKGRNIPRRVESAMWCQHKLFRVNGVRVERA